MFMMRTSPAAGAKAGLQLLARLKSVEVPPAPAPIQFFWLEIVCVPAAVVDPVMAELVEVVMLVLVSPLTIIVCPPVAPAATSTVIQK